MWWEPENNKNNRVILRKGKDADNKGGAGDSDSGRGRKKGDCGGAGRREGGTLRAGRRAGWKAAFLHRPRYR